MGVGIKLDSQGIFALGLNYYSPIGPRHVDEDKYHDRNLASGPLV